jgi:protein gp37
VGKSKIEWTTDTWNPIRARNLKTNKIGWFCVHESEGCRNCYAEALNFRLGTGVDYMAQRRDQVEIFLDEKMLTAPLHWKKPRMIFVCSMTDLFGTFVPDEMIDRMFAVMALCPQHTFQVLTKRPQRMRQWFDRYNAAHDHNCADMVADQAAALLGRPTAKGSERYGQGKSPGWPLPNVWLGTSCEDQKAADARIPHLLNTWAAIRFISCEPLLGPIHLYVSAQDRLKIDWVIVGGESGTHARPMRYSWAADILEQCKAAETACFVKQMGSVPIDDLGYREISHDVHLRDRKGGDPEEWPKQLRVREMP